MISSGFLHGLINLPPVRINSIDVKSIRGTFFTEQLGLRHLDSYTPNLHHFHDCH
ncbi:MAG: hypothetical protein HQL69_22810 [Magnetococcales bacterium]|nr:hypothetical protein [Magnetococcales bacterium]